MSAANRASGLITWFDRLNKAWRWLPKNNIKYRAIMSFATGKESFKCISYLRVIIHRYSSSLSCSSFLFERSTTWCGPSALVAHLPCAFWDAFLPTSRNKAEQRNIWNTSCPPLASGHPRHLLGCSSSSATFLRFLTQYFPAATFFRWGCISKVNGKIFKKGLDSSRRRACICWGDTLSSC